MVQADIAPKPIHTNHMLPVRNPWLLVKNLLQALDARAAPRKGVDCVPAGDHRPHQHHNILVKCDKPPDRDLSCQYEMPAVEQREQTADADHHIQQRYHHRLKTGNPQIFLFCIRVRLCKGFDLRTLPHECLDHTRTRKALLHKVRQI